MRNFVKGISKYSKTFDSNFLIIPQNGIELVSDTGENDGLPVLDYLSAIDGSGQEDLFYGYNADNEPTPHSESEYLIELLKFSKNAGKLILVTDYCSNRLYVDNSYTVNNGQGWISFAADERDLNSIPAYPSPIFSENNNEIIMLKQAKNFLYLINPENFSSKTDFISSITSTNYDLIIIDLFFNDGISFTSSEVNQLRQKSNGGKRLVICYMSIGEAEDYRYYWDSSWDRSPPEWIDKENPDWAGNFKVRYWEKDWQDIIYGNDDSYVKKIIDAGFDGIYLDIIDAFEFFE